MSRLFLSRYDHPRLATVENSVENGQPKGRPEPPPKDAPSDQWFDYYYQMKERGYRFTLKTLEREWGYSESHIKYLKGLYDEEHRGNPTPK